MSTPPKSDQSNCVRREDWDKCVRHGTWRIAVGIIVGAIGSAALVSEMPVMVGTGLGIGWAVKHCKNLMSRPPTLSSTPPEQDPCECCNSDFEALDRNEFDFRPQPPLLPQPPDANSDPTAQYPPAQNQPMTYPSTQIPVQHGFVEEQCSCNDFHSHQTPPLRPMDQHQHGDGHPSECTCCHE